MNLDEYHERQRDEQERFGQLQLPALWPAINAFIEYKTQCNRRPEYLKTLKNYLRRFTKGREAEPVASVDSMHIESWFKRRPHTPGDICAGLGRLGSFFTWAKRRKLIQSSPLEGMERPTVEYQVPHILTPRQARRLMNAAWMHKRDWVPYLVLGLYLGIRPEEIRKLTTDKVDLSRGLVTIDASVSKIRLRRLVPIHPKAKAWLLRCQLKPGQPFVTTTRVSPHMTTLATLAGFKWSHDLLRHSAASYSMALYQDAGKVSRWLGNSITILSKHYLELVGPEDCRRFWKCDFGQKRVKAVTAPIQTASVQPSPAVLWVNFGSESRTA